MNKNYKIADCKAVIEVKNGKINTNFEKSSPVDVAVLAEHMQFLCGIIAYEHGVSFDEIQSDLLDMHLRAVKNIKNKIRERGRGDVSQEAD